MEIYLLKDVQEELCKILRQRFGTCNITYSFYPIMPSDQVEGGGGGFESVWSKCGRFEKLFLIVG